MFFLGVSLTGWVTIFMTLSLGTLAGIMFMLGSKKVHYLWGLFTATGALWGAGFYMVAITTSPEVAQFWWKIAFAGIILAPFTFLHFVIEFVDLKLGKLQKIISLSTLYATALFFVYLDLTTNLLINEVTFLFNEVYFDIPAAPLHPYFTFLYLAIVLFAYFLVARSLFQRNRTEIYKRQAWYFFIGTGVGFLGASMDFLLVYGIHVHPIRNLSVVVGSFIVGFTILKFKLFNMRVVTAQFLTFFIIAFSIIRLLVSNSWQEAFFNSILLAFTIAVGVYLIFSVRREVEQRDQIQRLADNLKTANERLTELDKMKSQFLSIASHDLRAPLTAIRNFMSILLEGTYGKLPPAAEEGTKQVFDRSTEMAEMVDNYLNVSRIEQGRMKYDFEDVDFGALVNEVSKAFAPIAKEKGLTLNYKKIEDKFPMKADPSKMREVVENLINNAILYTEKGSITVSLEKVGENVRFTVSDTGVGMSEETIGKLFKLFSQGDDSRKYNPKSTGVGLYITKAHVVAHKGKIWAESDGEGKGSRFVVELPL